MASSFGLGFLTVWWLGSEGKMTRSQTAFYDLASLLPRSVGQTVTKFYPGSGAETPPLVQEHVRWVAYTCGRL